MIFQKIDKIKEYILDKIERRIWVIKCNFRISKIAHYGLMNNTSQPVKLFMPSNLWLMYGKAVGSQDCEQQNFIKLRIHFSHTQIPE